MAFLTDPVWWGLFGGLIIFSVVLSFLLEHILYRWHEEIGHWKEFALRIGLRWDFYSHFKNFLKETRIQLLLFFPWLGLLAVMVVFSGWLSAVICFFVSVPVFIFGFKRAVRKVKERRRRHDDFMRQIDQKIEQKKAKEQKKQISFSDEKVAAAVNEIPKEKLESFEKIIKGLKERIETKERKGLDTLLSIWLLDDDYFKALEVIEDKSLLDDIVKLRKQLKETTGEAVKRAIEAMLKNPEYERLINKYSVDGEDLDKYLTLCALLKIDLDRVVQNPKAFETFFSKLEEYGFEKAVNLTTRVLGKPNPS